MPKYKKSVWKSYILLQMYHSLWDVENRGGYACVRGGGI